jgi:hypothetical protein
MYRTPVAEVGSMSQAKAVARNVHKITTVVTKKQCHNFDNLNFWTSDLPNM